MHAKDDSQTPATLTPGSPADGLLAIAPGEDPRDYADRLFSSLRAELHNPYCADQGHLFLTTLIQVMVGTGQPFQLADLVAAATQRELLHDVLRATHAHRAQRQLLAHLDQLGADAPKVLGALVAALQRRTTPTAEEDTDGRQA